MSKNSPKKTLPNSSSLFWNVLDALRQGEIDEGYAKYYSHNDGQDYVVPKEGESVTGKIYSESYHFDLRAVGIVLL